MFSWSRRKDQPPSANATVAKIAGFASQEEFLNAMAIGARAGIQTPHVRSFYETACAMHGKRAVDVAGAMIRDGKWDLRFPGASFDEAINQLAMEYPESLDEILKSVDRKPRQ